MQREFWRRDALEVAVGPGGRSKGTWGQTQAARRPQAAWPGQGRVSENQERGEWP